MNTLEDFQAYEGTVFEVYIDSDKVESVNLIRATALAKVETAGYQGARSEPFELLFRGTSKLVLDQTARLITHDGREVFVHLNPECFYQVEGSGVQVTQYHCIFN